ncbi:hypothetical protein [Nocardiopsis sp. HUAS JQ3]|uniref:hypothetical protein n=1 Tax=Nocardiopsis sp. HUAS JQ3 TaxID=3061629 RepID=UPI0023A9D058|nr:hypothetical protein [Nocardiopsis sp. HUAS JQ3]WDZ90804.1 hypothetical protein PV789_28670 [Nocardiopsis sp. HUAS JQ3]
MTAVPEPRREPRTVFEVHEVESREALRAWARAHRVRVRYLGSTWQHEEVYGAQKGTQVRVCRTPWEHHRFHPIVWRSPLEALPLEKPPSTPRQCTPTP